MLCNVVERPRLIWTRMYYMISIIIPSRNNLKDLKRSIRALVAEKEGHEIIVVDDHSVDGSVEWLSQNEWIKTIEAEGTRAALMSAGAKAACGATLLFLSPGAVLERGWANIGEKVASQPDFKFGGFRLEFDLSPLRQNFDAAANLDKLSALADMALMKLPVFTSWGRSFQWPVWNQGLMVNAPFFSESGGFLDMPIHADLEWTHRMAKQGTRAQSIPATCVNGITPYLRDGLWTRLYRDEKSVSAFFRGKGVKELLEIQEGENNAVLVWYRAEEEGSVAQRVQNHLPEKNAKDIGDRLVRHILSVAERSLGTPKTVLSAVPEAGDCSLKQRFGDEVLVEFQRGNYLGEQLSHAMRKQFDAELEKVVLIDPICPEIDAGVLYDAFAALDNVDVVLGPTDDGECYLMGCKPGFEDIFSKVDWTAGSTFQAAASAVRANGARSKTLTRLRDIDAKEDFRSFYNMGFIQY